MRHTQTGLTDYLSCAGRPHLLQGALKRDDVRPVLGVFVGHLAVNGHRQAHGHIDPQL